MEDTRTFFNKKMLAYCGLYCEQCSFRLAYEENSTKHLQAIPYPVTLKELSAYNCEGCKGYCICGVCKIKPCAEERNIDSCADCERFPCGYIEAFETDGIPHHKTAIANLRDIKQFGVEEWFNRLKRTLICQHCGERQSWYYSCTKHK